MHSSGSMIKTFCEKVRHYLDDPDIDAKFDDSYLVRYFMSSAMTDVISRVSMMSDAQVLAQIDLTVADGTQFYTLPPAVRQVIRIGTKDGNGNFIDDFRPRNEFHRFGPGWSLEGNTIAFRPTPESTTTYSILYVPSGDVQAHYGTGAAAGSLVTSGGTSTFTYGATPTIGSADKRPNAYVGCYLRLLGSTKTDELIVSSHTVATRVVTTRTVSTNVTGTFDYEFVPFLLEPVLDAVALSAAMRASVGRKIPQSQTAALVLSYKQAIKTAYDTLGNMNSRLGKRFDSSDGSGQSRIMFS